MAQRAAPAGSHAARSFGVAAPQTGKAGSGRRAPADSHFAFAAKTHAVPVASTEFAEAARDGPLVFVGEEGSTFNVAALVGLRDGQNLMVDAQGLWAPGS